MIDLENARATYSAGCAEDAANLMPDLIAEIERLRLLATFPKSESGLITGLCMAIRKTEEQAAEIERLRGFETAARDLNNDLIRIAGERDELAARIQELEALLKEADQCRRSLLDQVMQVSNQRDKAEVRIQELEDALAEYQRLGKTIAGKVPCLALHGDCSRCSAKMREVCGALEQIAEGKIGPDADECPDDLPPIGSPYRSWQITDARKAALSRAYDVISWIDRVDSDNQKHIDVLRDMLAEATR